MFNFISYLLSKYVTQNENFARVRVAGPFPMDVLICVLRNPVPSESALVAK